MKGRSHIGLRRAGVVWGVLAGMGVCSAIAAGLVLAAPGRPTPGTGPAARPVEAGTPSDQSVAALMSFDVVTRGTGELAARKQVEIRNKLEFSTTITEIVKEGAIVKKGDVLAKMNVDQLQTQVTEQELQLETARAERVGAINQFEIQNNENDSAMRKAVLAVEVAELDLKQWLEGEVATRRKKLSIELDESRSELKRANDRLKQTQSLRDQGFVSQSEFETDQLAARKAEARVEIAELDQRVYEAYQFPKEKKTKESAVAEAKADLFRTEKKNDSQIESRKAEKLNRESQVQMRQTRLDKLKEQLAEGTIKAPNDGLVVYGTTIERWWGDGGPMQVGRQIQPNQLIIALPDTSEMLAQVKVPESIAGKVQVGQHVSVKIEAINGRVLAGTVDSIGLLAESSGWFDRENKEYTVKVALGPEAAGLSLRPSMRCESEIRLERVERALAVPVQAVGAEGLVKFVYVPSGKRYVRRPVQIGRRSDRFAEVVAGLSGGDKVLLRKPDGAELIAEPWKESELLAVGLKLDEKGDVVAVNPPAPTTPMPGAMPVADPIDGSMGERAPAAAVEERNSAPPGI